MSLARDIADLGAVTSRLDTVGASSGALSNRNLVTNGSMIISQRSTSVSSQTGSGYKTVDRIYTNASGATYNQSQQTVTVGGETGLPLQFTKYLRHNVTTGNNWSQIYHKIEDVALVPEGTVTLSFYAKGTSPNAGLTFYAWQNFGSGGSSEVGISSISQTVTLTSTWQRFTVPITVTSMTGKTIGTGSHFYFGIGQGGSTSTDAWTLDITGLQLEVGDTATDFEHRSFGDELQRCQRYYNQIQKGAWGVASAGGTPVFHFFPPVEMRVAPSYSLTVNKVAMGDMLTQGFDLTGATISANNHNTSSVCVWYFTASSFSATMTNFRPLLLESGGSFNGEVQMSAEL